MNYFKLLLSSTVILTIITFNTSCSQATDHNSSENSLTSKKTYQQKLTKWLNPYKIDIQQGNVITKEMLEKLHIGMTKPQVKQLMGTSIMSESTAKNQWLYVYNNSTGGIAKTEQSVILAFNQDGLLEDIKEEKVIN